MDKITRRELKTDHFKTDVQIGYDYLTDHRDQLIRWGSAALAVVIVLAGISLYRSHERGIRVEMLASAMQVQNTPVGPPQAGAVSYPTQAAKDTATIKAFGDIAAKYPGTDEAIVAQDYLGDIFADKGDLATAGKYYKAVADSGKTDYASQGKLSLAQIYTAQGKLPDAEKLLRSVIDKPTVLVSKDEATIVLARLIAPTKPEEARKLLDPLRSSERSAISRAALNALGELPQK